MSQLSTTTVLVLLIAVCAFFIVAKLLKVEKGAGVFALGVVVLWLILHFAGYDKTIMRVLFEARPVPPDRLLPSSRTIQIGRPPLGSTASLKSGLSWHLNRKI
jgi:hypothetical protein